MVISPPRRRERKAVPQSKGADAYSRQNTELPLCFPSRPTWRAAKRPTHESHTAFMTILRNVHCRKCAFWPATSNGGAGGRWLIASHHRDGGEPLDLAARSRGGRLATGFLGLGRPMTFDDAIAQLATASHDLPHDATHWSPWPSAPRQSAMIPFIMRSRINARNTSRVARRR